MVQPLKDAADRERILVMGAAGRDFHVFNTVYREDDRFEVVGFTAAQIEGIAGRRYPPTLAGALYPDGLPVFDEARLESLCDSLRVDQVVLAYSDLPHEEVMHRASRVLASGADFAMLGPSRTMLSARLPVIAVSATRTGCGKSQTARWLARLAKARGLRVAVLRHPMPYGDLASQAVQRFASRADLDVADCTIEEREEYEPHIAAGNVVYAGVDYAGVLALAEREADVVVWDGGNNDFPFVRPDLHVVLVDPLRAGDEVAYHPGEAVLRMADVVVVAKSDDPAAHPAQVEDSVRAVNPRAELFRGRSVLTLEREGDLRGRRVLVVEDGPTTTHGGMPYGAGYVAARRAGAQVVDPRAFCAPLIRGVYDRYPHIGVVLPAMGYSHAELDALRETIETAPVDFVVAGTPIDLGALVRTGKPVLRVRYEFAEVVEGALSTRIEAFLDRFVGGATG